MSKHKKNAHSGISRNQNTTPKVINLAAKKSTNVSQILNQLLQTAKTRQRQDISNWLSALRAAENIDTPRLQSLMRVYDSIIIDLHLSSVINTRKLRVMGETFVIQDASGNEDAEKTALLSKPWFYEFISLAMDCIFKGYGIIELGDVNIDGELVNVDEIPREHIVPRKGEILIALSDAKGIQWKTNEVAARLIEVGNPNDLGLLMKAAPVVLMKKNVLSAWSEYAEVFGMPIRIGKISSQNETDRMRMENFLKEMGTAPYAVVDINDDIQFAETKNTGAIDVYDKFIDRVDAQISKLIFGQTMTSDNGTSYGQAKVHEGIAEDYTSADRRFIEFLINYQLLPKLTQYFGYDFNGVKFKFNIKEEITELDLKIDEFLIRNFTVDPTHFSKKYGVELKPLKK